MKPNGCRIRTQETASARNRNGAAQRRLVVGDPVATASPRRGSHHVSGAPFAVPASSRPSTVRRSNALTESLIKNLPDEHRPAQSRERRWQSCPSQPPGTVVQSVAYRLAGMAEGKPAARDDGRWP